MNQWRIVFRSGKNVQFLHVNRITEDLGLEKCKALIMFHALSGCDSTSGLKIKGKRLWWTNWNDHDEVTETLARVFDSPFQLLTESDQNAIESLICHLYDKTSKTCDVNVLRMNLFCQKNQHVERIPPTQDALRLLVQRALYQASIWATSHLPVQELPDPCLFGWTEETVDNICPKWTSLETALEVFMLQVKCACRTTCRIPCKCKTEKLQCTLICKCQCAK
jgi:hypothetical protein